jgi:hypothetical protein
MVWDGYQSLGGGTVSTGASETTLASVASKLDTMITNQNSNNSFLSQMVAFKNVNFPTHNINILHNSDTLTVNNAHKINVTTIDTLQNGTPAFVKVNGKDCQMPYFETYQANQDHGVLQAHVFQAVNCDVIVNYWTA